MKLQDVFTRTCRLLPAESFWEIECHWGSLLLIAALGSFNNAQRHASSQSRSKLMVISSALRDDLSAAMTGETDESARQCIDAVRFACCVVPAQFLMEQGLLGECYNWTLMAISRDHDPSLRINHASYNLPPFELAWPPLNRVALRFLTDWIYTASLLARKFGGLDAHMRDFYAYNVEFCLTRIEAGPFGVDEPILALVALANWAVSVDFADAERLTRLLRSLFEDLTLQPRTAINLAVFFTTSAGKWTERTPQQWSEFILQQYLEHLSMQEVVQMMSLTVPTIDRWKSQRKVIIDSIRTLSDQFRSSSETVLDGVVALDDRFSIIHPIVFNLCTYGSIDDLLDVLSAWYGQDRKQPAGGDCLFICSAYLDGVAYVWREGRLLIGSDASKGSLEALLLSISKALNDYHRGPAGDRMVEFDQRLAGTPVFQHGPMLERTVEEHYAIERALQALAGHSRFSSMVIVPGHRDPIQAKLAQAFGYLVPLDASLSQPSPERRVQKVSIWPGRTFHTDAEIEVISNVAQQAGWEVCIATGDLNYSRFSEFYEDPSADVLWIIGHGVQSPYDTAETGLITESDKLINIQDMKALTIPDEGRRLLILNICSGGSSQNSNGPAHIGLAHLLASPNQSVIAHHWPIDHYAALAFGSALALGLAQSDIAVAMHASLHLMRNLEALLEALQVLSPDLEAFRRLSAPSAREHVENVISWGCPTLFT